MKALTLFLAVLGAVAAEIFLDERFSDGGTVILQLFLE